MSCNDVIERIPALIKREIKSEDRIVYIDHLKYCTDCRAEYLKYLKIFYTLEQQAVQPEPQLNDIDLDVQSMIHTSAPRRSKFWWPIAASFLAILLSTIIMISLRSDKPEPDTVKKNTLRQQLLNDNLMRLSKVVIDPSALTQNGDQTIPVSILLNRLIRLEQRGISKISITDQQSNLDDKEIELEYFIDQLKQYKKFKSALSVREISDFLYVI